MKTTLRLVSAVSISGLLVALLVLSRAGGALASIIPPEVLMAFAAIAALAGYAVMDIRREAPRGVTPNGRHHQIRSEIGLRPRPVIEISRPNQDRAAA